MVRKQLRISGEYPVPHTAKAKGLRLSVGPFPAPDFSRVVYVTPADPADVTKGPRKVLRRMRVGDSVFFPLGGVERRLALARLASAASLQGIALTSKAVEEGGVYGLRVWRIT